MSYQSTVLADAPIGYWRLGESSGSTAADSSGNGLNGTYNSASEGVTGLIYNDANLAVELNGTSGYVNFGNPSLLQIIGAITFELWFSLPSIPSHNSSEILLTYGYDGTNIRYSVQIGVDGSGNVSFVVGSYDGTNHGIVDNLAITAGVIYHLVATSDLTTTKLYLNGQLVASAADTFGAINCTFGMSAGVINLNGTNGRFFNGVIDEIAVYNYALPFNRVQAHFQAGWVPYNAIQSKYMGYRFGSLVGWQMTTFTGTYTLEPANDFAPTGFNPAQWCQTLKQAGCKYAILTTKGTAGFALWPSSATPYNISATTWYSVHEIDPVAAFAAAARAAGLAFGVYMAMDDVHYQTVQNPGYTPAQYTAYAQAIITELAAYGPDILWIDGWRADNISFTTVIYADVLATVRSVMPNAAMVVNADEGNLNHSDIAEFEGDGAQPPPGPGNPFPAEVVEAGRTDVNYYWATPGDDSYLVPSAVYSQLQSLNANRCNLMVAATPDTAGVLVPDEVSFWQSVGALFPKTSTMLYAALGRQGIRAQIL